MILFVSIYGSLLSFLLNGVSITDLAEAHHLSIETIKKIVYTNGIEQTD